MKWNLRVTIILISQRNTDVLYTFGNDLVASLLSGLVSQMDALVMTHAQMKALVMTPAEQKLGMLSFIFVEKRKLYRIRSNIAKKHILCEH